MMRGIANRLTSEEVKQKALDLGFDLVGVCPAARPPHHEAYATWIDRGHHGTMAYLAEHLPLKSDPRHLLPGAQSVIAIALNYNQPNENRPGEPRIARYALGRDYHKVLRSKLKHLAQWLQEREPESCHRACVDSAPVMERDFAQLAGLGWFGKNTMIINSRRGSWFFLGLLLTTLELEPDTPAVGGCGTCTRCVQACPTGAIVFEDERWQVDARRCISYLTIEHQGHIDHPTAGWTFGCDVCQEVCPFNQPRSAQPERAQFTSERDFQRRSPLPDLKTLADLDWGTWDEVTRGSAVRRAGIDGLRRNARLNLADLETSVRGHIR